jgi:polygalacturonase
MLVLALVITLAVLAADRPESAGAPEAARPTATVADYFVSASGSDESYCTKAAPCRSFDLAYQLAAPGDVIEVAGGSYPSQTLTAKPAAAPPDVVIREAPGARVIVGDPRAEVNCIAFEGARYVTVNGFETTYTTIGGRRHQCGVSVGRGGAHHITLQSIDAGMLWFGADDVSVLGGDFGPSVDENTKIEFGTGHPPRNVLIDGAVIHDARSYEEHPECVALWGGRGVTIRNTHFYNCETFHLWIVTSDRISNVLIEGNRFTQPDASLAISSTVKVGDQGGTLEDIVLRNNQVLVDEIFALQGYDEGGVGNITVEANQVVELITLGSRQDCMVDRTYNPRSGVVYECRGNRLVN